jgi:hypothetical protein
MIGAHGVCKVEPWFPHPNRMRAAKGRRPPLSGEQDVAHAWGERVQEDSDKPGSKGIIGAYATRLYVD